MKIKVPIDEQDNTLPLTYTTNIKPIPTIHHSGCFISFPVSARIKLMDMTVCVAVTGANSQTSLKFKQSSNINTYLNFKVKDL